ncbi:MAG: hypothetical protein J0L92_17745 [Deltaproteobacteria bacterium]|nr:hypothetical protein [Deltaproteobacteria bacterium]
MTTRSMLALALLVVLGGCLPHVDVDESLVRSPRVIAVRATPAEAAPGEAVSLEALYVGPDGTIGAAVIDWARCDARLPLAELGPINPVCLGFEDPLLVSQGLGARVDGTISREACRLFGPDPPPAQPGEPAGRIVDPDVTGGYYQPFRVIEPDDDAIVLAEVRLACGVAGATQAQASELRQRRRPNLAPRLDLVFAQRADGSDALVDPDVPLEVRVGETITLEAGWPVCPLEDVCGDTICGPDETLTTCADDCRTARGCEGAERYVRFDPEARAIVVERESMRVAWHTTAGSFEIERSGRSGADDSTYAVSRWRAPDAATTAVLWMVVRDARGGVGWTERRIVVVE